MSSKLRRGFKAEAERVALSIRAELDITAHDRLDCFMLAEHLGIPIVSLLDLQSYGASIQSIAHLEANDAIFSALTVCAGTRRLIVYNPWHSSNRQASSLAHELSHVIHDHPAGPAIGEGGCRYWDERFEAEAEWQAGALLVPRQGALAWISRGGTMEDGATYFGVSRDLFQWRVNGTGVIYQLSRRRAS